MTLTPCEMSFSDATSVQIYYSPSTNSIVYDAFVTNGSFLGLGYGTSMVDTDMIIFESLLGSSTQLQCYSTAEQKPTTVTNQYLTTIPVSNSTLTEFVSTRQINQAGNNTYQIPLNEPVNMVYAFNPANWQLSYHGSVNYGFFTIELDSMTGSCSLNGAGGSSTWNADKVHGITMFVTWYLISFIQILTMRYLKT